VGRLGRRKQRRLEELERDMAYRRINEIFDDLGDEALARLFLPNGLGGPSANLSEVAKALRDVGVSEELMQAVVGQSRNEAELHARGQEFAQRTIEHRRERIQAFARVRKPEERE